VVRVALLVLVAFGVVGGLLFAFGDRLRNPEVGMAGAGGQGDGRLSLKELHAALVAFADRSVSESRKAGLTKKLEMGGSAMRPAEWLVTAGAAVLLAFLLLAWQVHLFIGFLGAGLVGFGFNWSLQRKVDRRQKVFASQLGETLQLLASSLRAGLSLQQALNVVAVESPSPSGEEYRRVLAENRLGRDLTDAMYAMADRIGSQDFEWVVGAIDINRQAGGDLSVILDRVNDTIRQRERVRGQVKALSAEGRLSGIVMACLPPGVMVFVSIINPEYLDGFFKSGPMGYGLLVVSGLLLFVGSLWLKKLTKFTY
jgi:tight adherence protein B